MTQGCSRENSFLNLLEGASSCAAPLKILWNPHVPSKICFFSWEAWWGKVLTFHQLKKIRFHLTIKCPFYGKKEEELEHIMIHCPPIWGQWTKLLSAFAASWVPPLLIKDLLLSWLHFPVRKKGKSLWRVA